MSLYLLILTNIEIKDVMICCRHCRLLLLLHLGQQYYYKNLIAFFLKLFFSNCYFRKNIWKFHQNSEKHFRRKVLEKRNKNWCNLVPSREWLFNLIFVSFLMTTERNGRDLYCRYHTKLLLWINNVVYSILPTYFVNLEKKFVPNILKQ